jgi:predicted SprT family Zn-dependent metalloprotease
LTNIVSNSKFPTPNILFISILVGITFDFSYKITTNPKNLQIMDGLDNVNIHKHEILHLLLWLSSHPAQQSVGYIQEALQYCMQKMEMSQEEVTYFADQVQMSEVILGDRLPDDERVREVYRHFIGYLLRIKNQ